MFIKLSYIQFVGCYSRPCSIIMSVLQNTLYFSGSHIWYLRHNELTNELTKFVQIWFCCPCFRYHGSPAAAPAEWHNSWRSVGDHRCSAYAGEAHPGPSRDVGGFLLPAGNSQIAEEIPSTHISRREHLGENNRRVQEGVGSSDVYTEMSMCKPFCR